MRALKLFNKISFTILMLKAAEISIRNKETITVTVTATATVFATATLVTATSLHPILAITTVISGSISAPNILKLSVLM